MTLPILIEDDELYDRLQEALTAAGVDVTSEPDRYRDYGRIYPVGSHLAIDTGIRSALPGATPEEIAASVVRELDSIHPETAPDRARSELATARAEIEELRVENARLQAALAQASQPTT